MTRDPDAGRSNEIRILVAEDDRIAQLVLEKFLEQAGYRADFVSDGQEAIDALRREAYDMVLMDCFMPNMDGFEATRLIRKEDPGTINSRIPVVAMTGLTGKDDRRRCLEAGMDGYISKPVDMAKLKPVIERCLGGVPERSGFLQQVEGGGEPSVDDALMDMMVDRFVADIPDVIHALQRSLACEDLHALERIGHRLRGACDLLSVPKLSARAKALEQAGMTGNQKDAGIMVAELVSELERVMAVLGNQVD